MKAHKVMWGAVFKWDTSCPGRYMICFPIRASQNSLGYEFLSIEVCIVAFAIFFRVGRKQQDFWVYTSWF